MFSFGAFPLVYTKLSIELITVAFSSSGFVFTFVWFLFLVCICKSQEFLLFYLHKTVIFKLGTRKSQSQYILHHFEYALLMLEFSSKRAYSRSSSNEVAAAVIYTSSLRFCLQSMFFFFCPSTCSFGVSERNMLTKSITLFFFCFESYQRHSSIRSWIQPQFIYLCTWSLYVSSLPWLNMLYRKSTDLRPVPAAYSNQVCSR